MKRKNYIVVTHRCGASFYENTGPGSGMKLIHEMENPEGRLKDGEINSDKLGRSVRTDPQAVGTGASYSSQVAPSRKVSEAFAREIANHLEKVVYKNQVNQVVIAAEPRFMGILKAQLGTNTLAKAAEFLPKDLGHISEHDLPGYFEDLVRL